MKFREREEADEREAKREAELLRLRAVNADLLAACERVLRAIEWSSQDDRLRPEEMAAELSIAIDKAKGE